MELGQERLAPLSPAQNAQAGSPVVKWYFRGGLSCKSATGTPASPLGVPGPILSVEDLPRQENAAPTHEFPSRLPAPGGEVSERYGIACNSVICSRTNRKSSPLGSRY